MKPVREMKIKLANGYIKRAVKYNVLSVLELINKNDSARSTLSKALLTISNTKSSIHIHHKVVVKITA